MVQQIVTSSRTLYMCGHVSRWILIEVNLGSQNRITSSRSIAAGSLLRWRHRRRLFKSWWCFILAQFNYDAQLEQFARAGRVSECFGLHLASGWPRNFPRSRASAEISDHSCSSSEQRQWWQVSKMQVLTSAKPSLTVSTKHKISLLWKKNE